MTTAISKVSQNGSGLDVEWSDGEKSSFNFYGLEITALQKFIKLQEKEHLIFLIFQKI